MDIKVSIFNVLRQERNMESNTNDLRAVSIFINAMSNHKLSKADILLLNYLMMKYAGFEQGKSFVINQSKIAEDFALKQPNVSRSLKKLVASGLLKSEGLNTFSIDMK